MDIQDDYDAFRAASRQPANTPADWIPAVPTTGTVDDRDEPEDEREDENEIPVGAPSDQIEAPEEFEDNDEARDPADSITLPS